MVVMMRLIKGIVWALMWKELHVQEGGAHNDGRLAKLKMPWHRHSLRSRR